MSEAARIQPAPGGPHPDAVMVALVLDPSTYSRNRFFEMYRDAPSLMRARRRAAHVRNVIKNFATLFGRNDIERLKVTLQGDLTKIAYVVPSLGLVRTTRLDEVELALVRFALAKRRVALSSDHPLSQQPADRDRIDQALAPLGALASPGVPS